MRMKNLGDRQTAMKARLLSVTSKTAVATCRKQRGPDGCMQEAFEFLLANKDTYVSNAALASRFGMSVYTAGTVRSRVNRFLKSRAEGKPNGRL